MSGGTGRAGLTVVGQVVGSYFGPIGSMVGGMIGSAIGSALWPEQIEGPKLPEFQAMTSTYGAAIPLIWGGMRVGGNVFWCSPIREVEVVEEQGKGGGAELRYKKRLADIAIGLCLGEIVGIRKIWMNQKLVYDLGDAADIGTIFASFSQGGEGMRFYPGSATQMPDPTIEAVKGVGATPAYRGLAYIVMTDVELGGSFPNITAEVIRGGAQLGARQLIGMDWNLPYSGDSLGDAIRIQSVAGELIARAEDGRGFVSEPDGSNPIVAATSSILAPWPPRAAEGDANGSTLLLWPAEDSGTSIYVHRMSDDPLITSGTGGDTIHYEDQLNDGGEYIFALVPGVDREHVLSILGESTPTHWVLYRFTAGEFVEVRRGTIDYSVVILRSAGAMKTAASQEAVWYAGMMESDLLHVWQAGSSGEVGVHLWEISEDDWVMRNIPTLDVTPPPALNGTVNIFADKACCWAEISGNLYAFTRAPALTISQTLAELVEQICLMADLESSQIDVTDLEGVDVRGYMQPQMGTARAAIEPLMTNYGFDAVESDGKIKFVLRNATPVVEIAGDDLGAGDGSASESLVQTIRTSEPELPMLVEVSYMAPHADYQVGTQRVTRGTTESKVKMQVNLPLALADQEAVEIAYRIAYEGWTARYQREFSTTVKFAKYEPTDVVDLAV